MAKSQIPDSLLIKNYIEGNENSLSILINRHQSKIYGFIYSKINDRDITDDIFQDTFLKVIKKLKTGTYNEEGKFLSWVMRISHNLVIDYFRQEKRFQIARDTDEFSYFDYISDDSENVEGTLINELIKKDLHKLLNELPEDQKEVVVMRIFQDYSFNEIAEMTNVSINTALGRMRYAILNIRKLVEKNQIILTN